MAVLCMASDCCQCPEVRVVQVALSVFQQETELCGEIFAASVVTTVLPLFFFPLQKYYKMGISTSGMKE